MLDLKRLRIFQQVARSGSFSAGAAALDYSQPAVSHHIAQLELEVGARLIDRGPRGTTQLTPAGTLLLGHADRLLAAAAEAEAELAEVVDVTRGQVRLGAFATASATLVADAVGRLRHERPEVTVTLVEGEGPDLLAALRAHQIDLAIVFDDAVHPLRIEEGLIREPLLEDPMLLALPADHRLAAGAEVDIAQLAGEPWIEGAGATTAASLMLAGVCQAAGFTPRIAFNSGDYQVVQQLVAAGVGVALVPGLAAAERPGLVLRPVAGEPPVRRIAAVRRGAGANAPALAAMRGALVAAAARR
jgi:DNA-binding transcriptional LysR family regulator